MRRRKSSLAQTSSIATATAAAADASSASSSATCATAGLNILLDEPARIDRVAQLFRQSDTHSSNGSNGGGSSGSAARSVCDHERARRRQPLSQLLRVPGADPTLDPFSLVQRHLDELAERVRGTVAAEHPVLRQAARYFFEMQGKRFRPTVVLLMAQATSMAAVSSAAGATVSGSAGAAAAATAAAATAMGAAPSLSLHSSSAAAAAAVAATTAALPHISAAQVQLAMITELIHTASLVHDDVIDNSDTRRSIGTVNSVFGNQLAVLAGDFLLARASVCLAQLRNCDVVELLSNVIEHLVQGECLQLRREHDEDVAAGDGSGSGENAVLSFDDYMRKTWYKTASLIGNSCRAVALLAGHRPQVVTAAAAYGDHLGLAYQLVDDAMDFAVSAECMGKPALADLKAGTVTAPVLFSAAEAPEEVAECVRRRDVEAVLARVRRARGVDKTLALAAEHARAAVSVLTGTMPESAARAGLVAMADRVLHRQR